MPFCQVGGGATLFYAEKGKGQPLVFLNGLSGDNLYWSGQLRAFSRDYQCIALDNRDVGQSSYADSPYTTADLAGDVAALLGRLGLPPAHIIGLSMGGMVAQELALLAPERVRSLILVSTLGRADAWFRGTMRAFALIRRQAGDTAGFFEGIMPWWVSHRFCAQQDRVDWLTWLLRRNPHPQQLDGFLRQLDALGSHNALDRLQRVRCPVLVMTGEDDCVAPPRYSRELGEALPSARVVFLPGVGHAPPLEDPALFNARLTSFLDSTRTSALGA